ncbi:MAG: glutamate-5-semialdehyde dehydrogenase, partial [Clostridia bacterium]|nr:glutamate-5-semialdehyde dehydrogenase [Clostridia bacterium]
MTTKDMLIAAKKAAPFLARATTEMKNAALLAMADALIDKADSILAANKIDIENAEGRISQVMIDRLRLSRERIEAMAQGIRDVASLPDPVGIKLSETTRPNGLKITKVSVPLGVIAIIYESRPNVTSDAAALCIKSGNACVLRGGKEAFNSSSAIADAMKTGLKSAGLSEDLLFLVQDTTRASANELMTAVGLVDALIPRGGAGLIRACIENAKVPCIQTGTGICHVYVDKDADLSMALNIVENAKTSRPSVCNAAECCLVHKDVADRFLPLMYERLVTDRTNAGKTAVELRGDDISGKIIDVTPAGESDFDTEFLDYILAV